MAHHFSHSSPTESSMGYSHSQAASTDSLAQASVATDVSEGGILPPVQWPQICWMLARSFAFSPSAPWHPLLLFFCGLCNVSQISALNSTRPRKQRKGWGKRSRSTLTQTCPAFPTHWLLKRYSESRFTLSSQAFCCIPWLHLSVTYRVVGNPKLSGKQMLN